MTSLAAAWTALGTSWLLGLVVARRWGSRVLDTPGPRSSHDEPTTRLGGIALVGGLFAGLAGGIAAGTALGRPLAGVAVAAALAGGVGLTEDVRGVPVRTRLVAQVAIAAVVLPLLLAGHWAWGGAVAGAALVVGYVNVFNFMDGIDGIGAAQLGVAGLAWAAAGALADVEPVRLAGAAAAGAAAGFLPFNAHRAQMFMGDLGSYASGAWLAGTAIVGIAAGIPPVAILAPLAVFIFDSAWTIAARLRRGENVFRPHRNHFYQRLVQSGWSHGRTSAFAGSLMAVCGAAGLLAVEGGAVGAAVAVAAVLVALGIYGGVAARRAV